MPQYQIVGSDLQAVVCNMQAGETVLAETGHLLAMTDGLSLQTNAGGFFNGLKRAIGGSSFFLNEIVAQSTGQAVFASPSPGKIQELDVNAAGGWFCQPHVFLCCDRGVQQSAALTQRFGAGLFGGTGFVLQDLSGEGKAFIHVGGACVKYDLQAGQTLKVETGSLAAFQKSVAYDIQMVRGIKSILFSGEGLWFAHLQGPGTVYIQSLALPRLAHALVPYLPPPSQGSSATSAGVIGGVIGALLNSDS